MVTTAEQLQQLSKKVQIESARLQNFGDRIKKLAEGGFSREESAEKNILENRMGVIRKELKGLGRAGDKIRAGYTFESAYAEAQQKALAFAARKEAGRIAEQLATRKALTLAGMQKTQYETFRKRYSPAQALRLTEWSTRYKMSPTGETARRILQGMKVDPHVEAAKKAALTLVGVEKTQYETFRKRYAPAQALKLTEWSTRYKMSPTSETAKRILRGEKVIPTPVARRIAEKRIIKELPPEKLIPVKELVKEKIPVRRLPQPFFVERQVDTFIRKGEVIPITEIFYIDPITKTERKATASEKKFFRESRLEVTIPELPKEREEELIAEIKKQERILTTQKQRGKDTAGTKLKLASLAIASTLISTAQAIQQLPQLPKATAVGIGNLIKDPASVKRIPASIQRKGTEFGELLRISPEVALAKVGTEVIILHGTGKALKATGSLTSKAATVVSPKFRGVTKQVINVPSTQVGKTINIEIGGTLKKLKEPLKIQAQLAGKEVTAVSAQANKLVNLLKTKRVVRKPIPGEEKLSTKTKTLLKKFDEGKIAKKDLIKLDKSIRKETGRAGSLLERSFFADPRGRLRPSRLGVEQKEASLLDVLAGDVTFKTQKPQVLIFEKAKVEKFPKALKGIEKKLKAGKTLTRNEANKLLQFQLKKSSKWKPVGAISKEPEITLAPGEIIKKEKTIAVTLIKGKRVPIVRATIVKAKPGTKKLLEKARKGTIKTKELKTLRNNLRKETGFKTTLSRTRRVRPRVRIPKRVPRITPEERLRARIIRRKPPKRIPKRPVRRPPKKIPRARPPLPRKVPLKRPPRITKVPPRIRRVAPIPRKARPGVPIKPIPRRKKRIGIPKKKPTIKRSWNVYARPIKKTKKGRPQSFIKLNTRPLTKRDAKNLGSYAVDHSLSRTFKLRSSKFKPKKLGFKIPVAHYPRTRKKFRTYKIVKGKRKMLKQTFIEKSKYIGDQKSEQRGLTLRRKLTQMRQQPIPKSRVSRAPMRQTRMPMRQAPIKRKRTLSFAQSQALKKGREKLARMRR